MLALLAGVPGQALAIGGDLHAPRGGLPDLRRVAIALDPPVLYLAPRETGNFITERRALQQAIAAAKPGSTEEARAIIDLAEFHFAHGMAVEGLSLLSEVSGPRLPPAYSLRAAALELALSLIDSRRPPLTDRAAELLEPKHATWPDQALFKAMFNVREGDLTGAGPLLEDAVARLARFPKAVQEIILPGFLETAITTRQWRLARDLATAFGRYPALRDSPAYHFLLGQAAEAGHESVAAFDSYVRTMGGRDEWAHRARRALIDVALSNKAVTTDQAVRLLSMESELWRGDTRAARVLSDLATMQMVQGDTIAALESYGRLIGSGWAPEMADEARQKAHTLIDGLYRKGAAGAVPLADFMKAHDRVARYFRFDSHFSAAAESFADTFFAAGATTVAAREYETIHDYLAVAADLGIGEADDGRLDLLKIKEAEALLAGGQYEQLGALLQQLDTPMEPELSRRLDLVAARYYAETGQPARLVATPAEPSPQILRIKAQALFDLQNWAEAELAYAELWAVQGDGMAFSDAINFLLAAYRNGNLAQTAALAEQFPNLTELPGWTTIAQGLIEEAPELLPLKQNTAQARIDKAQETLDTLPPVTETN